LIYVKIYVSCLVDSEIINFIFDYVLHRIWSIEHKSSILNKPLQDKIKSNSVKENRKSLESETSIYWILMTILLLCNDLKFILQGLYITVSYELDDDFERYMVNEINEICKSTDNWKIKATLLFANFPNSCTPSHLRVADSEIVNFT
jgi:hypothetical protein